MNTNLSNKEQAEQLKELWKKYGSTVLLAVVVFMVANIGMRYWQQYEAKEKTLASITFSQMVGAYEKNKDSEFKLFANDLMTQHAHSPYASFAAMIIAKKAVAAGDLKEAQERLEWVIKHASSNELRELGRVRLARVLLAAGKYQAARELLHQGKETMYAAAKYELIGDAFVAENNRVEAAKNYHLALELVDKENAALAQKKVPGRTNSFEMAALPSPLLKMKAEQY